MLPSGRLAVGKNVKEADEVDVSVSSRASRIGQDKQGSHLLIDGFS